MNSISVPIHWRIKTPGQHIVAKVGHYLLTVEATGKPEPGHGSAPFSWYLELRHPDDDREIVIAEGEVGPYLLEAKATAEIALLQHLVRRP